MDTSTLLVVFLLVSAATLASYALSHWSSTRGTIGFGWAATSIGTTMLLTAAAIVVLTFVFRGPLWRPDLGAGQPLAETGAAAEEALSQRIKTSPFSVAPTASASSAPASKPGHTANQQHRADGSTASIDNDEPLGAKAAAIPLTSERNSQPLPAFKDADPWAATKCINVYRPGSDPSQWKIVNDCGVPVAVALDPSRGVILPAPAQRPVTFEEQSVPAGYRYRACFIATSNAASLIAAPSEERSTPEWRQQFESARASDGCLLRVPD